MAILAPANPDRLTDATRRGTAGAPRRSGGGGDSGTLENVGRVNPIVELTGIAGSAGVGLGLEGFKNPEAELLGGAGGNFQGDKLRINDFRYGLATNFKRGFRPLGSLSNVQNLVPNKKEGSLVLRNGYSEHISAVPDDVGGNFTPTSIEGIWQVKTTFPTEATIDVINCGTPTGIMQKPFWQASASATNDWLLYGESTSTTISGTPTGTQVGLTAGSATDDYYIYWLLYNSTRGEALYIVDYDGSTKVCTTLENVPSDWAAGDTIVLYRHFHDNPTFWATKIAAKIVLQEGDGILMSGGQNSDTKYKPVWSGYINKTFFSGASKTPQYQGTYITEAEIKSDAGISFGNVSTYSDTGNGLGFSGAAKWFIAFVLETDDGQFSTVYRPATHSASPTVDQGLQSTLTVTFGQFNKRLRYINVFLAYSADTGTSTAQWGDYYLVDRIDMLSTGWTYNESTTIPGNFTKTLQYNVSSWNNKQETLENLVGTAEYTSSTASFDYAEFVNNRLFIAKYYDYATGRYYNDTIRYSGFGGNGAPQINVLPNIADFSESTIEGRDVGNIQGIVGFEGKLAIIKDRFIGYIPITPDATYWELITVSKQIGSDAPNTITYTPYGVIFAKTKDDVYLWAGGNPQRMATNWRDTFVGFSNTNKARWQGVYDQYNKAYWLITQDSNSAVYVMFFDYVFNECFVWFKFVLTDAFVHADTAQIRLNLDGEPLLIPVAKTRVFKFTQSATTDNGTQIVPSFATSEYVIDENGITFINDWWMSVSQTGTPAGTFDCILYVDSVANTYAGLTKTNTFFKSLTPATAIGRSIQFEHNSNASPANFGTSYELREIGFTVERLPNMGDQTHSL